MQFKTAEKENKIIHLEIVTAPQDLPQLPRHSMVKLDAAMPDYSDAAVVGDDMFRNLVPLAVHQAAERYKERARALVDDQVSNLRGSTQATITALTDMNLPGALESLENPVSVPASLLSASGEYKQGGGLQWIQDKMDNLPALSQKALDILTEASAMLDAEEKEDAEMRRQYGERWSRDASASITEQTRAEGVKFRTILEKAATSDKTVQGRFEAMREALVVLGQGPDQIARSLPAADQSGAVNSQAVAKLKGCLTSLDRLRGEREATEREMMTVLEKDDITAVLMADKAAGTVEDGVFQAELQKRCERADGSALPQRPAPARRRGHAASVAEPSR